MPRGQVYLLFEGNLPTQKNSPKLLASLRAAARFGAIIGSVDTGAFALAQAGLIGTERDPDVVLHWEAVPVFAERFATLRPLNQPFLRRENRVHCAGGVATLDLLLDLIGTLRGEALACGFSYPSVFSRAFRQQFGQTPREFRRRLRDRQSQAVRPEIRRLLSV